MTRALLALTIGFSLSLATPGHAQNCDTQGAKHREEANGCGQEKPR